METAKKTARRRNEKRISCPCISPLFRVSLTELPFYFNRNAFYAAVNMSVPFHQCRRLLPMVFPFHGNAFA
ncbi:MAG TPA: hypothetical protein DEB39_04715 [Planctomycetaceae bacterium]|nr:hypothetical protein [Planctomycetaceae bacterium]